MGILRTYTDKPFGLGMAPAPDPRHKDIIIKLNNAITDLLPENLFVVYPESPIDMGDLNSKIPDVVVYTRAKKYKNCKVVLFVEITNKAEEAPTLKKVKQLMKSYSVKEAFVYNYETDRLVKFSNIENSNSPVYYSDILKTNIAKIISEIKDKLLKP